METEMIKKLVPITKSIFTNAENKSCPNHVDSVTTLYKVKMIALACRTKYDNCNKAKSKKANFLSCF